MISDPFPGGHMFSVSFTFHVREDAWGGVQGTLPPKYGLFPETGRRTLPTPRGETESPGTAPTGLAECPRELRLALTPHPSVPPRPSPSTKPSGKHSGLTASLGLLFLMKAPCHIKLGLNKSVDFSPVHLSLSVSRTQPGTLRRSRKTFSSPRVLTLISDRSALGQCHKGAEIVFWTIKENIVSKGN